MVEGIWKEETSAGTRAKMEVGQEGNMVGNSGGRTEEGCRGDKNDGAVPFSLTHSCARQSSVRGRRTFLKTLLPSTIIASLLARPVEREARGRGGARAAAGGRRGGSSTRTRTAHRHGRS
eukprot:85419-Pleurochrysis_carterae.AAC.2